MDLRVPIGGLFSIFGIILTVFGVVGPKAIYAQSLGVNVNILWGLIMLIFGGTMWIFGMMAERREKAESYSYIDQK